MSKRELQQCVLEKSGVSYDESLEATLLQPSMYLRIGQESGFQRLSQLFYDLVYDDYEPWFLNIFAASTKQEAIENQYYFLVQTFGGPVLYRQKKGKYTRLVGRHANYSIGVKAADRWLQHMKLAVEAHEQLRDDHEAKSALLKYFRYTAYYIVEASEFMKPDQVSLKVDGSKDQAANATLSSHSNLKT